MAKILVVGAGGVANEFLVMGSLLAKKYPDLGEIFSHFVLASRRIKSCERIRDNVMQRTDKWLEINELDVGNLEATAEFMDQINPDIVLNLATPTTDLDLMTVCAKKRKKYLDTANYEPPEEADFDYKWQWGLNPLFEMEDTLAILGGGFDPGVTNVYVAYAAKHHFDSIHYVDIVDCNAGDHGHFFATNFSPETNIREVTKKGRFWDNGDWIEIDPIIGEKPGREDYRVSFDFPDVGARVMYLLYHEELQSLVKFFRKQGLKRIRFWMTFGEKYLTSLWVLRNIGMTSLDPIEVASGVKINPLEFLAKVLPDPTALGAGYFGKTCIGCRMTGIKDDEPKTIMIYNVLDHAVIYKKTGGQAVAYSAGVPPLLIAYLMLTGQWSGTGVHNVEEFDPDPAMKEMERFEIPYEILEGEAVPSLDY